MCPDKEDIKKLTAQLKETLGEADRERERSREKVKKEEVNRDGLVKGEVKR